MWWKGIALLSADVVTLGLAIPIVAVYSGVRGNSDLYERLLSRTSRISTKGM
jgi:hypothetical protein